MSTSGATSPGRRIEELGGDARASALGETNMSPSGERLDASAALAALSTPTRITGGSRSRSRSIAPLPKPTSRGGRRVVKGRLFGVGGVVVVVVVVVVAEDVRRLRAAPPASTTSRSPPLVATSSAGARPSSLFFGSSPNATRIAAGAVELSSGRMQSSLRNTSDANARVATEPRVSRAATATICRAYVPATSAVTAPARTSSFVMASLLAAPRNAAPVSGSGRHRQDGSFANRTIETGSSWSVSRAW
jgi:hypothetical protein